MVSASAAAWPAGVAAVAAGWCRCCAARRCRRGHGHRQRRYAIRRNDDAGQRLVQHLGDRGGQVEIGGGAEDLRAVEHQVDAAGQRDLLGHLLHGAVDLHHDVLAGFLDDPVTLAEAALGLGGAILDFLFLGADLLRRQLGAFGGEGLAQIAQRGLFLLGVLVQLLAAGVQFLVGRLIGGGDPQHVGNRQDADDGGRGGLAFGNRRDFRRRRKLDLGGGMPPACSPAARSEAGSRRGHRSARAAARGPGRATGGARGGMRLPRNKPLAVRRLLGEAGERD